MKTPIEVKDIRKGDLIRCESTDGTPFGTGDGGRPIIASEFVAEGPLEAPLTYVRHFLLDRSHVVPAEPTFGWLSIENAVAPVLDTWWLDGSGFVRRKVDGHEKSTPKSAILDFIPATAVPKVAVERLDDYASEPSAINAIITFLAAVDAANGDAS